MNHKQLTFAREYRGFTQTELAKAIEGLSQSNLSKFEKGFGVLSEDVQKKIIDFLEFPKDFYLRKINSTIENAHYRKKASVNKNSIVKFENKCRIIGYIIDEFSETLDWPEFKLTQLNIDDGYTPEYIANHMRRILKIPNDEPIKDIFKILENAGIIIYEIDADLKFDGITYFSDKGFPVIVVNKNFSNDRKRFTLAHELGHLLMHDESQFPISAFRNKEIEANQFASEFLMPALAIKNSLFSLKIGDLYGLKSYWLTSMSSLIRKAWDLNCIDDNRYKYFMIEMSRSGFTKKEPIDVPIDEPTCLKNAFNILEKELSYTMEDFVKFSALPTDIIEEINSDRNVVKLKVLNGKQSKFSIMKHLNS